jgi:hypothetical protein
MMREGSLAGEGCFLTTCGSLQQTAMPGFTGLRIGEGIWRPYPASMPAIARSAFKLIWAGKTARLPENRNRPGAGCLGLLRAEPWAMARY